MPNPMWNTGGWAGNTVPLGGPTSGGGNTIPIGGAPVNTTEVGGPSATGRSDRSTAFGTQINQPNDWNQGAQQIPGQMQGGKNSAPPPQMTMQPQGGKNNNPYQGFGMQLQPQQAQRDQLNSLQMQNTAFQQSMNQWLNNQNVGSNAQQPGANLNQNYLQYPGGGSGGISQGWPQNTINTNPSVNKNPWGGG